MLSTPLRPIGIGRILDRSFQLYRKHFVKLTLIMLILYGPFYLLQSLLLSQESSVSNSMFQQLMDGASWEDILESTAAMQQNEPPEEMLKKLSLVMLLLPLFLLGLMPASVASVVHLVKAELFGEEVPGPATLLKKAFRRFWPMVGSTFLYGLIIFGIYFGCVIVMVILGLIFTLGAGVSGAIGGSGAGMTAWLIVFFVVLFLGFFFTLIYFLTRWMYYLPVVVSGDDEIGLKASWRLTRKSFWRLFGMFFVLMLILYLFLGVVQALIAVLLGVGLTAQLVNSLFSLLVSPLWLLPYAISFFDLKVRNEGLGVETMMESVIHPPDPWSDSSATLAPIVLDKKRNEETEQGEDGQPEDSDKKHE